MTGQHGMCYSPPPEFVERDSVGDAVSNGKGSVRRALVADELSSVSSGTACSLLTEVAGNDEGYVGGTDDQERVLVVIVVADWPEPHLALRSVRSRRESMQHHPITRTPAGARSDFRQRSARPFTECSEEGPRAGTLSNSLLRAPWLQAPRQTAGARRSNPQRA